MTQAPSFITLLIYFSASFTTWVLCMFLKLGTGKFIVCFYFYFHGFMVLQFV